PGVVCMSQQTNIRLLQRCYWSRLLTKILRPIRLGSKSCCHTLDSLDTCFPAVVISGFEFEFDFSVGANFPDVPRDSPSPEWCVALCLYHVFCRQELSQ